MTNEKAEYPCRKCGIEYCYQNCTKLNEWIERAEEAMNKQIPKNVIDMVADGEFICPSCHNSVPYWCCYCPDCGQRLE